MNINSASFKKDLVKTSQAFNELEKIRLNHVPTKKKWILDQSNNPPSMASIIRDNNAFEDERLNANLLALFKFADSETILEDVYPLFSAFIKEDEFKELYEYATDKPYDALVIDATRGKPIFKKNFDKILNIS